MSGNFVGTKKNAGDVLFASDHNTERADVVINAGDFVTTTGSSNAYLATVDTQFALAAGTSIKIKANFTNTAAATLNVTPTGGAATGAKSLIKPSGLPLFA